MTNDKKLIIPRQFGFSTCFAEISAELSKTYKQGYEIAERLKKTQDDCRVLAKKLLEVKPELEDWIKLHFREYL